MKPLDILIVDDDADLAEAIAEALQIVGHNPTVAGSGTEAIEKYCGRAFDITFMDVKLPDINGVETFLAIRKMDPGARVVMMTGYRIDQLLAQASGNGAMKVLHKPLAVEEILDSLREVVPTGLVLAADDDPDFAASAKSLLAAHGYDVLLAHTGKEAVERVLRSKPDILLLDLRLPIMRGLDVYLELKRYDRCVPTIIVRSLSKDDPDAVDALRSLEITGCLFKPFEPETLLRAIDAAGADAKVPS